MIDNLSIEVYAFVCRILMPFPVDETKTNKTGDQLLEK